MTVFELARLPRTALICAYLATVPDVNGDTARETVHRMSRERLVAAILDAGL
jgi:hypothetical protein